MANRITWYPPEDSSVCSVLIYRADAYSGPFDTVLATQASKDVDGNWVVSYTDSSTTDNSKHYVIQFYGPTGSGPQSDPISPEKWTYLCTFDEVKRTARLSSNSDVGSDEVLDAIEDANAYIFSEYGAPIKKTYFYVESGSYTYDFTGNDRPVYRVDDVNIGTGTDVNISTGSYTVNLRQGFITFSPTSTIDNSAGTEVEVKWVPKLYNTLAKNLAALDLIEATKIVDGEEITSPEARKIQARIDRCKEILRPKGAYGSTMFENYDERRGEYVPQDWNDRF